MKIVIENEIEKKKITKEKIDQIEKILGLDFELEYSNTINPFGHNLEKKIEKLSWNMGKKLYSNREELYER